MFMGIGRWVNQIEQFERSFIQVVIYLLHLFYHHINGVVTILILYQRRYTFCLKKISKHLKKNKNQIINIQNPQKSGLSKTTDLSILHISIRITN